MPIGGCADLLRTAGMSWASDPTREKPRAPRIVVDLIGESAHGLLAESRFVQRPFLPGGEHNMYELAFAAATAGYEVELRGWLERDEFVRMHDSLAIGPVVDLPARRPRADDLVIVPEGWQSPLEYARLYMSGARLAVFLLAPPGLFGWPFCGPGWTAPDPLTVAPESVGTPVQFQAMEQLGILLLTHSPGIVAAAHAAGTRCAFVGTGRPAESLPRPVAERSVDVAALLANRWAPLVEQVADQLDGLTVDLVEETSNTEVLSRLSRARVLLWPSRIEGHATIPWEARTVGCVPVALSTNRFAVGLTEDSGALVVETVQELAPAIRALLSDDQRWRELSKRAVDSARREVDWNRYVDRVRTFLAAVPPRTPALDARAGMGTALQQCLDHHTAEKQAALEKQGEWHAEEQRVRADRDRIAETLDGLYRKPEVQIALRLDALRHRRQS